MIYNRLDRTKKNIQNNYLCTCLLFRQCNDFLAHFLVIILTRTFMELMSVMST